MANNTNFEHSNKIAVMHVLAGLIKNPLLFDNGQYKFNIDDFPEQFHRIVFGAVEHLAESGMEKIDYIDIDQFIKQYPSQYKVFTANDGSGYISRILKLYDDKKFDYYYQTVKKYSLLNKLNLQGISTKEFLDPEEIDPVKIAALQEKFDSLTVNNILDTIDNKLGGLKQSFASNSDLIENKAGDGVIDLINKYKEIPEMGLPYVSPKMTTIFRGQRLGTVYIESAPSGTGKAIPNSSKIPTPDGWKTVGEIKVGDYLFDAKGHPTQVKAVFPQGEKEVWEVTFRDGRKCRCCDEHLWSFYTRSQSLNSIHNRKFNTMSLKEIVSNQSLKSDHHLNILIPQQAAVEYSTKHHYIDPYVMGALLGDGSFRISTTNHALIFSSGDVELVNYIAKIQNWIIKKNNGHNYSWIFGLTTTDHTTTHGNQKMNIWVEDALIEHQNLINTSSVSKFIPREYLCDSIENRWSLLNGLLDTDGTIDAKGRVSYFTISPLLRDNVIELARSLGFQTSVTIDDHKKTNIGYVIHIKGSLVLKKKLFWLPRKRQILETYLQNASNNKKTKKYYGNAMAKIEDLGYKEEMTCFLVDNEEHLFLVDDFIVTHNSRRQASESAHLAIPEVYNLETKQWEKTGFNQSVLLISTELTLEEEQTMWLSYISGVEESHIIDGHYLPGEEERAVKAGQILLQSNLYFVSITNYDVDDIITLIRRYHHLGVNYVYYDYLSTTIKIMAEGASKTKMSGLREDQILLSFITRLKDLAKELQICIFTATQLSGNWKVQDADGQLLRGAKALQDKVDGASILLPIRESDKSIIDTYTAKGFNLIPTHVLHVYKVRRSHYNNIKLYVNLNKGLCRITDCFAADNNDNLLPIEDTNIELILDNTKANSIEEVIGNDFDINDF